MELLLLSNGKANEFPGLLGWAREQVQSLLNRKQVKRILLIPYAVIRSDWDARARDLGDNLGVEAISIHHFDDQWRPSTRPMPWPSAAAIPGV